MNFSMTAFPSAAVSVRGSEDSDLQTGLSVCTALTKGRTKFVVQGTGENTSCWTHRVERLAERGDSRYTAHGVVQVGKKHG